MALESKDTCDTETPSNLSLKSSDVVTVKSESEELSISTSPCFLCLRNGRSTETEALSNRFLHFCQQYLKVKGVPEDFSQSSEVEVMEENSRGKFDFCSKCERLLDGLLNVYGEMSTLRARLLWTVGQLGEVLRVSSRRSSEEGRQLKMFRKFREEVEQKCHLKAQIIQPEVPLATTHTSRSTPAKTASTSTSTTRSGRKVKRPNIYLESSETTLRSSTSPPDNDSEHDPLDPDWLEPEDTSFLRDEDTSFLRDEDTKPETSYTSIAEPVLKRAKLIPTAKKRFKRNLALKRKPLLKTSSKSKSSIRPSVPLRFRPPTTHTCHCGTEFRTRFRLLEHMAIIHEGLSNEFLRCSVCNELQEGFFELQKHLEDVHETPDNKTIYCVFCYQRFTTQQLSDLHRREQHSKVYLARCPLLFCDKDDCPEKFMSVVDLNVHLQSHVSPGSADEGVFVCPKCGRGFLNQTRCLLHEILHLQKDSKGFYHCPQYDQCQIKLRGQRKLLNHFNKKHVDVGKRLALHACDLCKKRPYFISRKDLETHSKRHALELKCRTCGEVCLGSNELIVHKYNKHPEEFNFRQMPKPQPQSTKDTSSATVAGEVEGPSVTVTTTTTTEEIIVSDDTELTGLLRKCAYCPKKFVTFSELEKHKATEHGINANRPQPGRLVCDICGLVVSYKGTLARHMLTHSEPTIECPYKCGKMFRRTGNMEMHILKTHKKGEFEPQFVCDACGRGYLSRGLLNRHKKEHEKLVQCPMCSKMLRTTSRLKEHLRASHSTERFNCKWCQSVYTWETKLIAHVKKKHPEHYEDYYAERVKWRTYTKIEGEEGSNGGQERKSGPGRRYEFEERAQVEAEEGEGMEVGEYVIAEKVHLEVEVGEYVTAAQLKTDMDMVVGQIVDGEIAHDEEDR